MLHKAKELSGWKLSGQDGELGKIKDFYFDDENWTIRYLVVDAGHWWNSRMVLISPYAVITVDESQEVVQLNLTKEQIRNSPSWDTDKPVSRQFERDYYAHYGWPIYWGGPYLWGIYREPRVPQYDAPGQPVPSDALDGGLHLRSTGNVSRYDIQATDGEVGHVEDFLLDDETWSIRYLVVDTRNWWPGKKVLVAPQWIDRVSWEDFRVYVKVSRETIRMAPEYNDEILLNREYETGLYLHYNKQGYWADREVAAP